MSDPATIDFAADDRLVDAYSLAVADVAERLGPAVCAVAVAGKGLGSGVVLSPDGLIVTNAHVVRGNTTVELRFADARRLAGHVIGSDPDTDIALVKAAGDGLPAATLGDSARLRRGQVAIAIGNDNTTGGLANAGFGGGIADSAPVPADIKAIILNSIGTYGCAQTTPSLIAAITKESWVCGAKDLAT